MSIIFNGNSQNSSQLPLFNMEELIKDAIGSMLMNRMNLRSMGMIRYIEFFPTYTMCEQIKEKSLSSMFLKLKYSKQYVRIPINEIEMSGATIVEFIDFLYEKGAKEVQAPTDILEII